MTDTEAGLAAAIVFLLVVNFLLLSCLVNTRSLRDEYKKMWLRAIGENTEKTGQVLDLVEQKPISQRIQ